MSSRARLEITVTYWTDNPSIGHIRIRIETLLMSPVLFLSVFGSEKISSDKGSIDISDTFSFFRLSRKCGNIHLA